MIKELIYKTERDSQTWRADLRLPGEGEGRIDWEFGIDRYTLLMSNGWTIETYRIIYRLGNCIIL